MIITFLSRQNRKLSLRVTGIVLGIVYETLEIDEIYELFEYDHTMPILRPLFLLSIFVLAFFAIVFYTILFIPLKLLPKKLKTQMSNKINDLVQSAAESLEHLFVNYVQYSYEEKYLIARYAELSLKVRNFFTKEKKDMSVLNKIKKEFRKKSLILKISGVKDSPEL